MSMVTRDDDFYEDDEPAAKIIELFERGPMFQTRPPQRGFNRYFDPFRRAAGVYPGSRQSPVSAARRQSERVLTHVPEIRLACLSPVSRVHRHTRSGPASLVTLPLGLAARRIRTSQRSRDLPGSWAST